MNLCRLNSAHGYPSSVLPKAAIPGQACRDPSLDVVVLWGDRENPPALCLQALAVATRPVFHPRLGRLPPPSDHSAQSSGLVDRRLGPRSFHRCTGLVHAEREAQLY